MLVADLNEYHPLLDGKAYAAGHAPDGTPYVAVILRATYSNSHVDTAYVASLAQAREANLMVGHYGYLAATVDAGAQGTFFGSTVKANGGLLPGDSIWCDCEEGTGDQSPRVQAFLAAAHAILCDPVQDEGFYSGSNFYTAHIGQRISVDGVMAHLWIAAYQGTDPALGEDLWQYTDKATVFPGVSGAVDASIFTGTAEQYRALFTPPTPVPAPGPDPIQMGDTLQAIPFSCTLDANGWFCAGISLPDGKTALNIVNVVMDAASPYDGANNGGPWRFASASPDYQPVTAGTARIVIHGDPGCYFTGRVIVG